MLLSLIFGEVLMGPVGNNKAPKAAKECGKKELKAKEGAIIWQ